VNFKSCAWRCLNGRWAVAAPGVLGLGLIGFGLILQLVEGVVPCPMCIMQRWVWIAIIACSAVGAWWYGPRRAMLFHALHAVLGVGGAYVAARQSWLQWYPPEVVSCGRDFYGIVDTFPLRQALPLLLKGSGDCSAVDWTFLGGSIANWSFVMFVVAVAYSLWKLGQAFRHQSSHP
jgi:disulfide bond formation protein DsbB